MPFEKKHNLIAIKEVWTLWVQGKRPDIENLQALAEETKVPLSYLYKKTAKWRLALKADLQGQLGQVETKTPSRQRRKYIGSSQGGPVNAKKPLSPLSFTDEYRDARKLGKEAMSIAMRGLIEEATTGTGASRVSAIRELLDRAGLAKDKERKDEPSPYEDEDTSMLMDRLVTLLGSNTIKSAFHFDLGKHGDTGEKNPTTSQEASSTDSITPSPSLAQNSEEVPQGVPGSDVPLEQGLYGPRVMIR